MRSQRTRKTGSSFDEIGLLCRGVGALPESSGGRKTSSDAGGSVGAVEIGLFGEGGTQHSARSEGDGDKDREGGGQEGGKACDHDHGE